MPLFIQHTYPSYKWGVWKMDETQDELLNMLPQQETYLEGLQRFSAEHRRLECLSLSQQVGHSCMTISPSRSHRS